MTKREDLRLQGDTGSKTGGDQSEKGNKKRAHRDTTRISRMLGTTAFSARTGFSVTTASIFRRRAPVCWRGRLARARSEALVPCQARDSPGRRYLGALVGSRGICKNG